MRISQKALKSILKEALELSPGNKEKTIAALKQRIEDEDGAMSGAEAKETAETESGVTMSDDDFEELASSAGIATHKSGDVVDTEGLTEGNKVKITKNQLRQIIKEEILQEYTSAMPMGNDPGRDELGEIYMQHLTRVLSSTKDPVVMALIQLVEDVAGRFDITQTDHFMGSIDSLVKAVRGS